MQKNKDIAIIGGGPAGLMAAEVLAMAGHRVTVYDRMPRPGRKFLMAGRGGLNLTHSEPLDVFLTRYGKMSEWISPYIHMFSPDDLRNWCEGLGEPIFVGSSGRVFPKSMKAAPLLRAWLRRLDSLDVKFIGNHKWQGEIDADATLLALGGASWPRLGSDGSWVNMLEKWAVAISPLRPANSGFVVNWSEHFRERFAGEPLKSIMITHKGAARQGEAMISKDGLEGGVVYAVSEALRNSIEAEGGAVISIDLRPDMTLAALAQKLQAPRGSKSLSSYLRNLRFSDVAIGLLRETTPAEQLAQLHGMGLADRLKALPLTLTATASLERAISTAGGICREAVNDDLMLIKKPGVFVAGEMLDWESPTGGYLLQGCMSTGYAAAQGILRYLS